MLLLQTCKGILFLRNGEGKCDVFYLRSYFAMIVRKPLHIVLILLYGHGRECLRVSSQP